MDRWRTIIDSNKLVIPCILQSHSVLTTTALQDPSKLTLSSPRTSPVAPSFIWSHLWEPAIVNPVNLKSYTIPIFNLRDPYGRAFHLRWRMCLFPHLTFPAAWFRFFKVGFFVVFLFWFTFPPFIHYAIKTGLHLTAAQVGNPNIIVLHWAYSL